MTEILSLPVVAPIAIFTFVASITPGPNNIMLAASGLQYGFRQTLPHIVGIQLGFNLLILLAYLGISQLLLNLPGALLLLRLLGSAYLLYLAWKILGITFVSSSHPEKARPLTIWQAGLFQFANPKAWIISTSAMALAIPLVGSADNAWLTLCLSWPAIGFLCNCLWVLGGTKLNGYLNNTQQRRIICCALAIITLLTVTMFWLT